MAPNGIGKRTGVLSAPEQQSKSHVAVGFVPAGKKSVCNLVDERLCSGRRIPERLNDRPYWGSGCRTPEDEGCDTLAQLKSLPVPLELKLQGLVDRWSR